MAKIRSFFVFGGLGLLLIGALAAYMLTGERKEEPPTTQKSMSAAVLVDESPVRIARSLLQIASTADEQDVARESIRIADDEVDLAFAAALLAAQEQAKHIALTGEARAIQDRIDRIQEKVAADQARVAQLAGTTEGKRKSNGDGAEERLSLAKSQLALDQDELDDARQDLIRSGADPVARVQEQLDQHQAAEHRNSDSATTQAKPSAFQITGTTLWSHLEDWWQLRNKKGRLLEARLQALIDSERLERYVESRQVSAPGALQSPGSGTKTLTVEEIESQSRSKKILATDGKRILDQKTLTSIYLRWGQLVSGQYQVVWHAILGSALLIVCILIGAVAALWIVGRVLGKGDLEDRRLATTRVSYRAAIQAIAAILVFLVVFGVPNQLSTLIALAGAGLAVVLKEYIVGFFGWFTLMGPHGVRVADWVEINGITGEVIEVGLVRTVLLETGNWNQAGNLTGRKVSFVNSYAIEGHYLNFTTSGQWLWDEIHVPIPAIDDPKSTAAVIVDIVARETAGYAALAEQELKKATQGKVSTSISTNPGVELRPAGNGMDLVVRYVAQAPSRSELRARLLQAIVASLYGKSLQSEGA